MSSDWGRLQVAVEGRGLCFLDPDWICIVSSVRRLTYLKRDCGQDCPPVKTSSWQFRWINSLQSLALLLAAIKLTPCCFPNWRQPEGWCWREVGWEECVVCETVCVKGNLFFTSQANHFETRGMMLQNRSYSIKLSVKLQPLLLERLASLSLLGSSGKETISTLVSSGLK